MKFAIFENENLFVMWLKLAVLFLFFAFGTLSYGQESQSYNFSEVQCGVYVVESDTLRQAIAALILEIEKSPIGKDDFIAVEVASRADSVFSGKTFVGLANFAVYTYHPTWYDSLSERLSDDLSGVFYSNGRNCLIFGNLSLRYFKDTSIVETIRYRKDYFPCYCAEDYRYIYVKDDIVTSYIDEVGMKKTWPYPFLRSNMR